MTPAFVRHYLSPLGRLTMTSADGLSLFSLTFDNAAEAASDCPVFDQIAAWLDRYFSGIRPGELPPLAPAATSFRQTLQEALLALPFGQTLTYGSLARQLHTSPRALGQALGANRLLIVVPCHRVVGSRGRLIGYAGGLWRKAELLRLEGIETSFFRLRSYAADVNSEPQKAPNQPNFVILRQTLEISTHA